MCSLWIGCQRTCSAEMICLFPCEELEGEQSGPHSIVDTDKITTLVNAIAHLRIDEIRDILDVSHGSVVTISKTDEHLEFAQLLG